MLARFAYNTNEVEIRPDDDKEFSFTAPWVQFFAREFVGQHLLPAGSCRVILEEEEKARITAMVSAAVTIPGPDEIRANGIDWSVFIEAANEISKVHWLIQDVRDHAAAFLAECLDLKVDPVYSLFHSVAAIYQIKVPY